ncbi:phage protein [Streptococcus pneumoniae]|uniref:DUF5361 domain-containing protein n=1 Tax=Streptococcus pneumoniae TaxID=1313 RepID=UPI0005DFC91D|nr:DUF5361 domain-containing protein [Streptococcus pneumoniae]MDS8564773.1 DUF5361 domain-containing protein [Streptococcus pneumoniae]CIO43890.1 phage protein [Streptococcus pneumoniae]
MIALDEDALVCDLAETYQIYDYKQLPLSQVAVFAYGLRDDSRIKQMMSDQIVPLETTLLASIVDRLSVSLWLQTKDGQKGVNRPMSIAEMLTKNNKEESDERDYLVFESGEDFENYRKALLAKNRR